MENMIQFEQVNEVIVVTVQGKGYVDYLEDRDVSMELTNYACTGGCEESLYFEVDDTENNWSTLEKLEYEIDSFICDGCDGYYCDCEE